MSSIKYFLSGILWEAKEEGNQIVKDYPVVVLFKSQEVLLKKLCVLDYSHKSTSSHVNNSLFGYL